LNAALEVEVVGQSGTEDNISAVEQLIRSQEDQPETRTAKKINIFYT